MSFVNIGFGNMINTVKIVAMISPDSAPAKRMIAAAREQGTVIDATQGRRTRCVIVCDNNIILSALMPDTITGRINGKNIQEVEEYDS
ncbi:MAG: DUF370 domain-containing protein [Bacteroidaceae bacterium]|nr:DUF370 domain-containing protein [Bacteroidaceae bacterium]